MKQSGKKNFYVIGGLIILLFLMYLWKVIAVNNVQKQMESRQIQLIQKSHQAITDKTRYFLRLTTTTFVWALRKEMLRENYEQINEYLIQFVKEPNIKQILVVKTDGTVAVATDKKLEGVAFSTLYPSRYEETTETVVADDENGNILIASPIMGLNRKLGIVFLVYEPEKMPVEVTQEQ